MRDPERLVQIRLFILGALALVGLVVWLPIVEEARGGAGLAATAGAGEHAGPMLEVSFLDVGQGDAVFIETPDGVQVLIDGGRDSAVLRELGAVMPFFDRSIDVVVATHSDEDHIGGLVDVLERYEVGMVVTNENQNDTVTADAFAQAVAAEGAAIADARAGDVIQLGAHAALAVFSPAYNPEQWESNAASIVAQLRYGDVEFLFTGDAPIGTEAYLVDTYGEQLASEVLKLGHHGADTSTSERFLTTVAPDHAVVSAGVDNRYGHPAQAVLERVATADVPLLSTIERGRITLGSDGATVWVE